MLMAGAVALPAADAQAAWKKDCAKCHGDNGDGNTKMGKKLKVKDYTNAEVQAKLTDEVMVKAIKEGVKEDGKTRMKGYDLPEDEVQALVKLIRGFKK